MPVVTRSLGGVSLRLFSIVANDLVASLPLVLPGPVALLQNASWRALAHHQASQAGHTRTSHQKYNGIVVAQCADRVSASRAVILLQLKRFRNGLSGARAASMPASLVKLTKCRYKQIASKHKK